jgi:hypothetical protein
MRNLVRLALLCLVASACYSSSSQAPLPSTAAAAEPATNAAPATACVASGCSSTLCVPAGKEMMSTCEYKPEYACYQKATCEPQPDGACGWTHNADFDACLAAGGGGNEATKTGTPQ